MLIKKTKFKNLFVIKKSKFRDKRGYFYRDFCINELNDLDFKIKQSNISFNNLKYTLRGFHYQIKPFQEKKIISCLTGSIINVSIDLRKNSKTYLKIFRILLSEKNNLSLHVPKGFANAYLTLQNKTKVLYYMSEFYNPNKGRGIRYNDSFFSVKWPHIPRVISTKDQNLPDFEVK